MTVLFAIISTGAIPVAAGVESKTPFIETGIASWYDSGPEAGLTANGERFDPEAFTAAHKQLKFGTVVRVRNLSNNLVVDVRINDRGPYVEGRIIDLTPAAASALDMVETGITPVELSILYEPEIPESHYDRPGDTGWYRIQTGTFSNTRTVSDMYKKFVEVGFKPSIEIVQETMLRLTIRWIPSDRLEESMKLLSIMGFPDVLVRSEKNPYL